MKRYNEKLLNVIEIGHFLFHGKSRNLLFYLNNIPRFGQARF
jgi:hypothetical protein